jgi:hypothetical protein
MSIERIPGGTGIGAEPGAPGGSAATTVDRTSPSMRLQILSTEHWSLLATRSLAWNESFSRGGMFLSTLSGAMVALALVAQASPGGSEFGLFALVILPVVLFIGVATFVRLGASNYYDAICVVGMNRIRAAYLELAPDLAPYFVMSANDDGRGIAISMGVPPGRNSFLHLIAATPAVIGSLDAVLAGAIASIAGLQIGLGDGGSLALGIAVFVAAAAVLSRYAQATIARARASIRPMFPSPDGS